MEGWGEIKAGGGGEEEHQEGKIAVSALACWTAPVSDGVAVLLLTVQHGGGGGHDS